MRRPSRPVSNIRASRLLHQRIPELHPGPKLSIPQDLAGRRLFVFERAAGVNYGTSLVWLARYDEYELTLFATYVHQNMLILSSCVSLIR